jgi:SAM-dependent methyltransferase
MKESLTSLLCSPFDGSSLSLDAEQRADGEVIAGQLLDASGHHFRIVDGVPLFAGDAERDEAFDYKWKLIGKSYGHEEPTRSERQAWYLQRYGFDTREHLQQFLNRKSLILDAGTGSGVDAAMFAECEGTVIAIDLSPEAALATYRHLGLLPNVHVLQADLTRLPFPPGVFDFVSCDQVLHHTPNTADAFASLVRHVRAGGHLGLYVYKRKGAIREYVDDYLRAYTTQLTAGECFQFCESITELGKALSDLKVEIDLPKSIPILGIDAGRQDVQRFFYWNVMKCFWNDRFDFITNVVVNFDWYHPKYAWRHSPEEVRQWFVQHGMDIQRFDIAPSGITVLGHMTNPTP